MIGGLNTKMILFYKKPRKMVSDIIKSIEKSPEKWKAHTHTFVHIDSDVEIWISNRPYADCDIYKPTPIKLKKFERALLREAIDYQKENMISKKVK